MPEVRGEGRAHRAARSLSGLHKESRSGQGVTDSEGGGFLEQSLALQGELSLRVKGRWDFQRKQSSKAQGKEMTVSTRSQAVSVAGRLPDTGQ